MKESLTIGMRFKFLLSDIHYRRGNDGSSLLVLSQKPGHGSDVIISLSLDSERGFAPIGTGLNLLRMDKGRSLSIPKELINYSESEQAICKLFSQAEFRVGAKKINGVAEIEITGRDSIIRLFPLTFSFEECPQGFWSI